MELMGNFIDDDYNNIVDKWMDQRWWRLWQEQHIVEEIQGLNVDNAVFRELLQVRGEKETEH